MASIHHKDRPKPWVVYWRDGKSKSRSFATEKEAQQFASLLDAGKHGENPTLWQACQKWLTESNATCRHKTYIHYRYAAKKVCDALGRDIKVSTITPQTIAAYRDGLAVTLQSKTVVNHLRATRALMSFCVRSGWVPVNPVSAVKMPQYRSKIPRWLSDDQSAALVEALRDAHPDIRLALLLALRAGLRLGDLVGLSWADVQADYITVGEGKSKHPRIVPIHPDVRDALATRPRIGDYVFVNRIDHHRHRHSHQFGAKLRRWLKQNGFGCGVHSLRHTFATQLAGAGATMTDLRQILGHTSMATSEIYLHSSRSRQNELVARLGSPTQGLRVLDCGSGW